MVSNAILTAYINDADFATDVASGLNVRLYNYVPAKEKKSKVYNRYLAFDREYETVIAPFVVYVYDDGLDYDLEGNPYWDSSPDYVLQSVHATLEDAQREAAYLEDRGTKASHITIGENCQLYRYKLKYLRGKEHCV